jgi:hypothetical protein
MDGALGAQEGAKVADAWVVDVATRPAPRWTGGRHPRWRIWGTLGPHRGWRPSGHNGSIEPFLPPPPFYLSSPPSLSIVVVTSGDPKFRPSKVSFLSVKLFPKVYSSSSPTYFTNAPCFMP